MGMAEIKIPKNADVQTSIRLPKEHMDKLRKLAEKNSCTPQAVIRFIIGEHIMKYD